MSAVASMGNDKTDKKTERPLSMKKIAILASVLLLLSVMSVICYSFSIGINLWIDALAQMVPVYGVLAFLSWVYTVCLFFYSLFKRQFSRAIGFLAIGVILLLVVAIIMPATGRLPNSYLRKQCAERMQEIGASLKMYAKDHGDLLPENDWCDVIIQDYKQDIMSLFCRGNWGRFREGESSYVLNTYIITTRLSDLPSDTVMAFETDFVGENPDRRISLWDRKCMKQYYRPYAPENLKEWISESAWNQVGDISIISFDHHAGLGCNILFADGHVEFVRKKDIPKLRWKP